MPAIIPGKLIWLFHAHTGSRATKQILQKLAEKEKNYIEKIIEDHHGVLEPEQGEVVISTIRDPIDYVLSWWRHSARPTARPIDYFNDISLASRHFQQNGRLFYYADRSDILISFNNLETNVRTVCQQLGLSDPGEMPIIGVSEKRNTENYQEFREQLEPAVNERYPLDISLWQQVSRDKIFRLEP